MTREDMEQAIHVADCIHTNAWGLRLVQDPETRERLARSIRSYTTVLFRWCGLEGR